MNKIIRFNKEDTILVAIDFQEKLMPAVYDRERVQAQTIKLIRGMDTFGIPKIVTTQYAKGLGQTVEPIAEVLGEHELFDKVTFSAYKDEGFRKALEDSGRKTVVLAGVEAHICVQQTALDLVEAGYKVALAADCVSSRTAQCVETALMYLSSTGVAVTCGESILFDILGSAKAPEFKTISATVK